MKAEFGWTVVRRRDGKVVVYKRDCDVNGVWTQDLVPYTFPTRREAKEAAKKGIYRDYNK